MEITLVKFLYNIHFLLGWICPGKSNPLYPPFALLSFLPLTMGSGEEDLIRTEQPLSYLLYIATVSTVWFVALLLTVLL
jgi:hypothetical protein